MIINISEDIHEDLDHLTKDGELPLGWYSANSDFIERIREENRHFRNAYIDSIKKGAFEECSALKSLVNYMESVQEFCAAKGECFVEWASIFVANPSDLSDFKERIKYLENSI